MRRFLKDLFGGVTPGAPSITGGTSFARIILHWLDAE
jgi:hypothetical protein